MESRIKQAQQFGHRNITRRNREDHVFLQEEQQNSGFMRVSAQVCELNLKSRRQKREEDEITKLIQAHNNQNKQKRDVSRKENKPVQNTIKSLVSQKPIVMSASVKQMMKQKKDEEDIMKMLQKHNSLIKAQRQSKAMHGIKDK
jgi:hypothetical protein